MYQKYLTLCPRFEIIAVVSFIHGEKQSTIRKNQPDTNDRQISLHTIVPNASLSRAAPELINFHGDRN